MKRFWLLSFLIILLIACSTPGLELDPVPTVPVLEPAEPEPVEPAQPPADPTDLPAEPTEPAAEAPSVEPTEPSAGSESPAGQQAVIDEVTFAPPLPPQPSLARDLPTDNQRAAADSLLTNLPPERDDVQLAIAYRGLDGAPTTQPEPVTEPLPVGTVQQLVINNTDVNTNSVVDVRLLAVSDHAYFWFDQTRGNKTPTQGELDATAEAFDQIYEDVVFFFGQEDTPGIDGDPRIHIVSASPLSICNVTEDTSRQCGLLGYFSSRDTLPQSVDPQSNAREMFVMNGSYFGTLTFIDTLAHEFRHMIEDNYDTNDIDWEVEGSAMLAEDLLGFSEGPINRANAFLANPDQQLNRWTDGNSLPYYGQGYLLNRYIYDRLGTDLYRQFATSDLPGLQAVTAIAQENNLDFTGLDLWRDWLAASVIHNEPNVDEMYEMPEALATARTEGVNSFPTIYETTVNQYAADYYQLFGDQTVTVEFVGSTLVPLMSAQPASGETMWVSNRANNSHARLTRAFDLTNVEGATLQYSVYRDIELGYDFGYASLSLDGGVTWQSLNAENMDGLKFTDNPAGTALTGRFYTGRGEYWVEETVDLTPFVGQEIHIRFEYVTDPILNFDGLAIDNIAIPEIGFVDDVETDQGWNAEGFVRATGYLPQEWHLQLVTFVDGVPVVEQIELSADQSATFEVDLDSSGGGRPILIVAANAPMTLVDGHYQLEIN